MFISRIFSILSFLFMSKSKWDYCVEWDKTPDIPNQSLFTKRIKWK